MVDFGETTEKTIFTLRVSLSPTAGRGRGPGRSGSLVLSGVLLLLRLSLSAAPGAEEIPAPRAVSGAEKAAVEFALAYLSQGSGPWVAALAPESRFASLDAEAAKAEIEARAGPAAGAVWELRTVGADWKDRKAVFGVSYPSGLETTLTLDLAFQEGKWRLADVSTFAEPQVEGEGPRAAPPVAPQAPRRSPAVAVLALGLVCEAIGFALLRRSFRAALVATGIGAAAIAAAIALAVRARAAAPPVSASAPKVHSGSAMAVLRRVRNVLAVSDRGAFDAALAEIPSEGPAGAIGRVWKIEWALHERDLARAARLLDSFPATTNIPEVHVLRGRLGFLRSRPADVARSYDAALRLVPQQDGLLVEAASLLKLLGDDKTGDADMLEAAHMGSRLAEVGYSQAAYWIDEERGVEAEKWFQQAWRLRPVERSELLPQVFFWDLLRRPALYAALQLDSTAEPTVRAPEISTSPVAFSGAARVCGSHLRFRIGSARLDVPGGSSLAPTGTGVDDAGAWTRAEEQEAISNLPRLTADAASGNALVQPLLRRQLETAVSALMERHRWDAIVQLTDGLADYTDWAPSELIIARAQALRHTDRSARARDLLAKAVANAVFVRRSSPASLFGLAMTLSSLGDYDRAVEFAEKAKARMPAGPAGEWLIQRMKMEQRLSASFATYSSEHFLVRYPRAQSEAGTRKLAMVLEGERERLQHWIPLRSFARTEVQLLWFDDFEKTYSGGVELVGLFDGKIRLPFAGGDTLDFSHPEIVSIVTHELAHAMISELTLDAAPHWLQEGLAQHVSMTGERFNPIPLYESRSRFLSLPVTEGILAGLPAPDLAESAYEESVWLVHYLEVKHGVAAIHRLLSDFREGSSTEDAVRRLSYSSVSDLEGRFREWCRQPASRSWRAPAYRYLGDRRTAVELPASLKDSDMRVRWSQSEEPFPETTPSR